MIMPILATVRRQNVHEQTNEVVARIYPYGKHNSNAQSLNEDPSVEDNSDTLPGRTR
jgi:trehalose utilization protein